MTSDYHFISRWRVEGTCGEVADVIGDPTTLARWWPAVYLDVEELEPPNERGVGRRMRLQSKGWLPYTIRWEFVVTENFYPNRFAIQAFGDFVGTGMWTFEQDGPFVKIVYDWRISAEKPLLKAFTPILRPLFSTNHEWAMRQGEESLRLELRRRRATSDAARATVPPPPAPVTYAGVALVGGAAMIGETMAVLLWRARRRRR